MSGLTSESTEFSGGRCRACGRTEYGLAEDGPRCYGCERFVIKDDGATCWVGDYLSVPIPMTAAAPPLTLKMLEELDAGPSPEALQFFEERSRFHQSEWDRHRAIVRAMPPPPPKRRKQWVRAPRPLKTEDVMAEAKSILKESST